MKKLNKKEMVQNLAEQYAVNVKVGDVIRAKQETHYRKSLSLLAKVKVKSMPDSMLPIVIA